MGERRFKTLIVLTHPIQYMSPILRETAKHPKLDLTVAYCSLEGAQRKRDPDFGVELSGTFRFSKVISGSMCLTARLGLAWVDSSDSLTQASGI